MSKETHEMDSETLSALKTLIGKPIGAFYGREVHAEPHRGSASCPKGVFWLGEGPDYITVEPALHSTKGDQEFQLLTIQRSKEAFDLPANERTGAVGPCSLIEVSMPGTQLMSIDVIQLTAELDDDIVVYDHAVTLRFDDDTAFTIQTEHDSLLEALVLRSGEAKTEDPDFQTLETRMTLK